MKIILIADIYAYIIVMMLIEGTFMYNNNI